MQYGGGSRARVQCNIVLYLQQQAAAIGAGGSSLGPISGDYNAWNESSINHPESSASRLNNYQPTFNEDFNDDMVSFEPLRVVAFILLLIDLAVKKPGCCEDEFVLGLFTLNLHVFQAKSN